MAFDFGTLAFSGTADGMTYTKVAPVFSITGMSVPLATLGGLASGGNEEAILGAIFAGNDQISGSTVADILKGYAGNDIIVGGAGADAIDGGNGTDAAGYYSSGAAVIVNLTVGFAFGGDAQGDVLTNIENLGGSVFDDFLTGDAGANGINGGAGGDNIVGAAGADMLYGGDGNDVLSGFADADGLVGGAGVDLLDGGDGNDALNGGAGADTIGGGAGIDIADYNGSGSGVTVNLATNANTGGYAQDDALTNVENLQGSAFGDTLTGDGAANTLRGMDGNDVLAGGAGWDTLEGGNGDDHLNGGAEGDVLRGGLGADQLAGGSGYDVASYYDSAVGVTINLQTQVNTGGTAQGDTIANDVETINGSTHDDVMTGNTLGNALIGFDGNDTLSGAGGNDTLRGGAGADTLNGGAGADYFSYTAVSDSTGSATDTIQDFQAGTDLISLRLIDADGNPVNGDTAFAFLGTGAFTGTAGELRYAISGTTTVSADVDGNGAADIVINLTGAIALQASNFLL
jgi:Ca2+-binding RTX toxin-like protein